MLLWSSLPSLQFPENFKEMANTLGETIDSNVFIVSRKGKLLGLSIHQTIENDRMKKMIEERQFPEAYTNNLFNVTETSSNLDVDNEHTAFPIENKYLCKT